mgnify:CR=1 FL=1
MVLTSYIMPMQSTRFDGPSLALVRRAAAHEGVTVSEFIRRAALDRAATAPDPTILERLRPFIGILDSSDPTIVPVRSELGDYLSDKHRREVEDWVRRRENTVGRDDDAG